MCPEIYFLFNLKSDLEFKKKNLNVESIMAYIVIN